MMVLVWKQSSSNVWYATTKSGQYVMRNNFLWFQPSDGKTIDHYAEGNEYLGKYDNPKTAAQQHADQMPTPNQP